MIDKLGKVADHVRSLVPPDSKMDPRPWRINVFVSIVVIGVVLGGHLAATGGYLERIGISAVASASEVKALDDRSKAILKAIYSPQIRAKVRERCDTDEARERERINVELDRLKREYRDAAGVPFAPMPTCLEV